MCPTHLDPIAHLPRELREQLNRRLQSGQPDEEILDWLKALPETAAESSPESGASPLTPQDLSAWRAGGYLDWQAQQRTLAQARQAAAEVMELQQTGQAPLAETLSHFLAAQYLVAARAAVRQAGDRPLDLQTLAVLSGRVAVLRHGDYGATRLVLTRERMELDRRHSDEYLEQFGREWASKSENLDKVYPPLTPAQKMARFREIMGLPPEEPEWEDEPDGPIDPAIMI